MLAGMALALGAFAFSSCTEDEEMPPVAPGITIPQATMKANTSILDFKKAFWQASDGYYTEVTKKPNGEDYIIRGRVVGNDLGSNIYKTLMIQDSTAAVTIVVDMSSMGAGRYKIGEEVILNCTGLYAGRTQGNFQIGEKYYYKDDLTKPQIGNMSEEQFLAHVQVNGLPQPDSVYAYTMGIGAINAMASNADSLMKYQSQLIRLNDVSFKGGGTLTWGEDGSSHAKRYLYNQAGQSIVVDCSGYSDFANQTLPAGHGDVQCILSYYSGWQLVFVTNEDCFNFGGESYAPVAPEATGAGTAADPYNVGSVLEGAAGTGVWVTGYIVGWIDGMTLSTGANFTVPASVNSNILLAATPDEKIVENCIPIALPNGTAVRTNLNLQNNAGNLGKQVSIRGNLATYFGAKGLKECDLYVWGDKGDDDATMGDGGSSTTPTTPTGTATFKKATTVTSGKQYVMVADGKVCKNSTAATYGWLYVDDATVSGDEVTTDAAYAYTFTSTTGGFTIQMSDGRYIYQTGTYNSFNFSSTVVDGCVWTATAQADGTFKITNVAMNKYIQYSAGYSSFGSYADSQGTLPTLYEKVN